MLPIRTILHPTDFSQQAANAFELACALARDYGAKLVVLHVLPTPVVPVIDGGVFPVPMEVPRHRLQQELGALKPREKAVVVERILVEGDPTYEIVRAADSYQADLIAMGTHGRGGLARLVMGSVADAVTRKANCPVLTVRTPVSGMRTERDE